MSVKKDQKIKAIPDTLRHRVVEVKFKLSDVDIGKNQDDVLKVEDDLMISNISKTSMCNGLIIGDRLLKVNGVAVNGKSSLAPIFKGGNVVCEVSRRENISPITPDRLAKQKMSIKPGYAYFIVNAYRPPHILPTSPMGMTIKAVKNRALLTKIEPNSVTSLFYAIGDSIADFDGSLIPFGDTTFIRDEIAKFAKTGKMTTLVERPILSANTRELWKYLLSITPAESDNEMAADVKAIGMEASKMHIFIFCKLKPPSILSSDIRKGLKKTTSRAMMTEGDDKGNVKISTASTEMRITSDVEDEEDLKDVVKKSHASGSSGMFDDE